LLRSPLLRYRFMAYLVGVGLVILVCIGVPLRYAAGVSAVVQVVGPLHGFLYIVYVLVALDMAWRYRIGLVWTAAAVLAGTVPFMSFVVERLLTRRLRRAAEGPAEQPLELPGRSGEP
jgi:integral membrane protein